MVSLFVPYILLVLLYIYIFGVYKAKPPPGSIISAIFKCLPIIYILFLVQLTPKVDTVHETYKFYISLGFVFSLFGDWSLNWSDRSLNFIIGLGLFALAQVSYTFGFGFHPFGGKTAFTFVVAALIVFKILLPAIKPQIFRPFVVFYMILLGVMGWRATARYKEARSVDTWLAMAGAVSFIVSDFTIGYNKWKNPFPRAVLLIMVTYYFAQLLFTYSVLWTSWEHTYDATV